MPVLAPDNDAFGAALADHAFGGAPAEPPELILEVDDGYRTPALPASWFFLPEAAWSPEEREVLAHAPSGGPVLEPLPILHRPPAPIRARCTASCGRWRALAS